MQTGEEREVGPPRACTALSRGIRQSMLPGRACVTVGPRAGARGIRTPDTGNVPREHADTANACSLLPVGDTSIHPA
jgi:hypothetical protein